MSDRTAEFNRAKDALRNNLPRAFMIAVICALGLIVFGSCWAWPSPTETAVVTRFGAVNRELPSGFHFKLPWPIEDEETVDTKIPKSFTLGEKTEISEGEEGKIPELAMLTKDTGIVVFKCAIQYRVRSATKWLIESIEPVKILENLAICATRQTSGAFEFYELSVDKRSEAQDNIQKELQALVDDADLGVEIVNVQIKDSHPPSEVKSAFENVMQANESKGQKISEAQAEVNKTVPRASGEAQEAINGAMGEASRIVNSAKSEVAVFNELLEQYRLNPEATKARMVFEANEAALNGQKRVVDRTGTQNYRVFGNR